MQNTDIMEVEEGEGFYDLIIKCNSIAGLKNGWEVKMTEKGKKIVMTLRILNI